MILFEIMEKIMVDNNPKKNRTCLSRCTTPITSSGTIPLSSTSWRRNGRTKNKHGHDCMNYYSSFQKHNDTNNIASSKLDKKKRNSIIRLPHLNSNTIISGTTATETATSACNYCRSKIKRPCTATAIESGTGSTTRTTTGTPPSFKELFAFHQQSNKSSTKAITPINNRHHTTTTNAPTTTRRICHTANKKSIIVASNTGSGDKSKTNNDDRTKSNNLKSDLSQRTDNASVRRVSIFCSSSARHTCSSSSSTMCDRRRTGGNNNNNNNDNSTRRPTTTPVKKQSTIEEVKYRTRSVVYAINNVKKDAFRKEFDEYLNLHEITMNTTHDRKTCSNLEIEK